MKKLNWELIKYKNPPAILTQYNQNAVIDNRFTNFQNLYNTEQMSLLNYFKNFEITNTVYEDNNPWTLAQSDSESSYATHKLNQHNFSQGTYRIRKPGYYILTEDIEFLPLAAPALNVPDYKDAHFLPTTKQITDGDYPTAAGLGPGGLTGYYHMGFFAAITIEADGVVLDLNGYTIKQSELHKLQQRFFACIETASAPFIQTPKGSAGPSEFGPTPISSGKNVYICNGKLLTSSHHGIHGNGNENILIENLLIANFEIGGIQLNGSKNTIVRNINICNGSDDVRVTAAYSQARFLLPFLNKIDSKTKLAFKTTPEKTIEQVIKELNAEMKLIYDAVKDGSSLPASIFTMDGFLIDGNRYGIVLAQKGPVVGPFQKTRKLDGLNENVIVHDIMIENLDTKPKEILAMSTDGNHDPSEAYGGARVVDAVGGVFTIRDVQLNGAYKANVLSNAQLIIAVSDLANKGKTNFPAPLIEWALAGTANLNNIINGANYYYVGLGDSMGHTMKGDIGVFLQGATNGVIANVVIGSMKNSSLVGITYNDKNLPTGSYVPGVGLFDGSSNTGIAIIACEHILVTDIKIEHLESVCGVAQAIKCQGANKDISIEHFNFANIICGKPSLQGGAPNPAISCDFIYIDSECYDNISLKVN